MSNDDVKQTLVSCIRLSTQTGKCIQLEAYVMSRV